MYIHAQTNLSAQFFVPPVEYVKKHVVYQKCLNCTLRSEDCTFTRWTHECTHRATEVRRRRSVRGQIVARAVRFHWVTTDSFRLQILLCYAPPRSPKLPRDPRRHEIPKRLHGLAALCDAFHLPFGCSANPNNEMFMQEFFVKECVPKTVRTKALQILNASVLFIRRSLQDELYSEDALPHEFVSQELVAILPSEFWKWPEGCSTSSELLGSERISNKKSVLSAKRRLL